MATMQNNIDCLNRTKNLLALRDTAVEDTGPGNVSYGHGGRHGLRAVPGLLQRPLRGRETYDETTLQGPRPCKDDGKPPATKPPPTRPVPRPQEPRPMPGLS
ncbi:hypothetical protein RBB50_006450 [Rhinocladiella similis]